MTLSKVDFGTLLQVIASCLAILAACVLLIIYVCSGGYRYIFIADVLLIVACYIVLESILKQPSGFILRWKRYIGFITTALAFFITAPITLLTMTEGLRLFYHDDTDRNYITMIFKDAFIQGYFVNIYSSLVIVIMGYMCREWIRAILKGLIRPIRLTISLPLMMSAAPILKLKERHERSRYNSELDLRWYFAGKTALEQLKGIQSNEGTDIAIVSDIALLSYVDNDKKCQLKDLQYIPFCKITGHIKLLSIYTGGAAAPRPEDIYHFEGSVHEDYIIRHLKYSETELINMKKHESLLKRSSLECVVDLISNENGSRRAVLAWEPHYVSLKNLHRLSVIDDKTILPSEHPYSPYEWALCVVARRNNSNVEMFKYEILSGLIEACDICSRNIDIVLEEFSRYIPCELSGVTLEDLKEAIKVRDVNDNIVYGVREATESLATRLRSGVFRSRSAGEWALILEEQSPWFGYKIP